MKRFFEILIAGLLLIIVPLIASELISTIIMSNNIQVVSYVVVSIQCCVLFVLYYQNR
ncbi:MAG: hypothetical protein KGZ84_01885 [Erysipelotrichia bacterium]|nr:hypothetical protein [Erysipelotrichia bacterium]